MVFDQESLAFSFLSAREALGLLAYGHPDALNGAAPGEPDMFNFWGYSEGSWTSGRRTEPLWCLRWVWARVRWRLTRVRRHGRWRRCPLPPLGRVKRAQVRHLMRKHRRPAADLIRNLAADIERARVATMNAKVRVGRADRVLCNAAAEGRLTVFGRRGRAAGGEYFRNDHEQVPPTFFLNRHRTLAALWNWATIGTGPEVPMDEWMRWRASPEAPDWGDLKMPKAEVLALLPPEPAPLPPPALSDLPARWGLLETLAWIMFRDPAVVRDASPDTPRPATDTWQEVQVPGQAPELAPVGGEPGYSRLRLTLRWQHGAATGSIPPGLAAAEAEADLLAKLRSGAIIARGRIAEADALRNMDPGDWRGLALRDADRGEVVAEGQDLRGLRWRDVTLARDDVVRVWSGTDAEAGPLVVPEKVKAAEPPKPEATREAVSAWLVFREKTWPKDAATPSEKADLAAARAAFAPGPALSRDVFRDIRQRKTTEAWRKPGPRNPR